MGSGLKFMVDLGGSGDRVGSRLCWAGPPTVVLRLAGGIVADRRLYAPADFCIGLVTGRHLCRMPARPPPSQSPPPLCRLHGPDETSRPPSKARFTASGASA